jgi:hypothetical protein
MRGGLLARAIRRSTSREVVMAEKERSGEEGRAPPVVFVHK